MTKPKEPGWYDDPDPPNAQRYWDGQSWTPHRQRKPASRPAPRQQSSTPAEASVTPPPPPPSTVPPPPPPPPASTPEQPAAAPRAKAGLNKAALVLTGIALLAVIAALVAARVKFGTFLPGTLIVSTIAALAAFFTLRSKRSVLRKAILITTMVLVVAAAIPASAKVVFPAYNHFFPAAGETPGKPGLAQSHGGAPGPQSHGGAPGPQPEADAPQQSPGGAKSGILVFTGSNDAGNETYGFIDPDSGKYSQVASFPEQSVYEVPAAMALSPDFTKRAVTQSADGQSAAGWLDASGKFTPATPKFVPQQFGASRAPDYQALGFDGDGNFYYTKTTSQARETYKLAAGSTSDAQLLPTGADVGIAQVLNYDGSMLFCSGNGVPAAGRWLGPNNTVQANGTQIIKYTIGHDGAGCPTFDTNSTQTQLLPKDNTFNVSNAVGNPDGTKVAFVYDPNSQSNIGLYIVTADGSGQPTKVNLTNLTGQQLSRMTFLRWI